VRPKFVERVPAYRGDCALAEIDDARAPVDEDEPLSKKSIESASAQTKDQELDKGAHVC
jgi:hypothetical protein